VRENEFIAHCWIHRAHGECDAGRSRVCLAAGMDDYISKAIKTDELGAALERAAPHGPSF